MADEAVIIHGVVPPAEEDRREFLTQVAIGACALTGACAAVTILDYLEPKVLFEPPTTFRAGNLADFPEGTLRFNQEQKVYLIGSQAGIFALSAVCTHLGCITRPVSSEGIIACPCHGSRFDLEGNVIQGPAPRPLPWLEVSADAGGNLTVDTSVVIPHGKALKA